jgi:hypothetical protein
MSRLAECYRCGTQKFYALVEDGSITLWCIGCDEPAQLAGPPIEGGEADE